MKLQTTTQEFKTVTAYYTPEEYLTLDKNVMIFSKQKIRFFSAREAEKWLSPIGKMWLILGN